MPAQTTSTESTPRKEMQGEYANKFIHIGPDFQVTAVGCQCPFIRCQWVPFSRPLIAVDCLSLGDSGCH